MDPLPPEINIPAGLKAVLECFSKAAVIIQPDDIKQFACFYFSHLLHFRDQNPHLDMFNLVKEFHDAEAGVLTSDGIKTNEELFSPMASDYKDYLNEDGILSILAGADQTEAVVVFRRTDKIKHSEMASDHVPATDGRSAFFERVPLSEIKFTSNTVLIKTPSIPCRYLIVVHSEKVPECIVFQKESTESPSQPGEETAESQKPESLQFEETETLSLLHDDQIESALATSSIPELMETSNIADVRSELTELIRKFKTFMGRIVSPQQELKEFSETCLPVPGPEETTSSQEQPQTSYVDESSKQGEADSPPAAVHTKVSKPMSASSEPEEMTIDFTNSPVSTSHRPVSLTSTAKDKSLESQANTKETMTEETTSSPKTSTTASQTGVSGEPVKTRAMSLEHHLATFDLTSVSTNQDVNVSAPFDVNSPSVLSPEAFQESRAATPCYLHVHPDTRRLSQQTHVSCSTRESSHHTIRPATCGCNWRLCHVMLPEYTTTTCSARSVAMGQCANEHLLIPDHPRVPVYRDVSACSSIYRMQPDAVCPCQSTCPVSSSRLRLHTAPPLLSSDQYYSQSHDAVLPRYIFFKSLPHERHAGQAMSRQGCMLADTHWDEIHQCVTQGQCSQQCCKCEEHHNSKCG